MKPQKLNFEISGAGGVQTLTFFAGSWSIVSEYYTKEIGWDVDKPKWEVTKGGSNTIVANERKKMSDKLLTGIAKTASYLSRDYCERQFSKSFGIYWSTFCWFNVNCYSERKYCDQSGLRPHNLLFIVIDIRIERSSNNHLANCFPQIRDLLALLCLNL